MITFKGNGKKQGWKKMQATYTMEKAYKCKVQVPKCNTKGQIRKFKYEVYQNVPNFCKNFIQMFR